MSRKRRTPAGRSGETSGEAIVRRELMRRRISFVQEAEIGPYSVDFFLDRAHAVIEVDGWSHWTVQSRERDLRKDEFLRREGYIVFRFTHDQLRSECSRCLNEIERHVRAVERYRPG